MPHLDGERLNNTSCVTLADPSSSGVSATSLIRQFDPMTPIISMTSNSNPNQVLTYFSHGMNDILPKPFTKEGLLSMLEVSVEFRSRSVLF